MSRGEVAESSGVLNHVGVHLVHYIVTQRILRLIPVEFVFRCWRHVLDVVKPRLVILSFFNSKAMCGLFEASVYDARFVV